MGSTRRHNLIHYAISDSAMSPHDWHQAACSAGHRQQRAQLGPWAAHGPHLSCTALYEAAPPAVGPAGTTGRARAAEATSTHAHLGTTGRGTLWEQRAASGQEELRDSECTYASTHAYLGTAGRGTRKGTVGCEAVLAGRRSCVTRSVHTDVDVT